MAKPPLPPAKSKAVADSKQNLAPPGKQVVPPRGKMMKAPMGMPPPANPFKGK